MLQSILTYALYTSLFIHVVLMAVSAWKLWNGENVVDRLMASDLVSTLTLAVLVLAGLIFRQKIYIDVALGLAALGYITVITFAKYITDRKMF